MEIKKVLEKLQDHVDYVKNLAEELKNNASDVRDRDVEGAYQSIKESQKRSQVADALVNTSLDALKESMRVRLDTEDLLVRYEQTYKDEIREIDWKIGDMSARVDDMNRDIVDLNDQVRQF